MINPPIDRLDGISVKVRLESVLRNVRLKSFKLLWSD